MEEKGEGDKPQEIFTKESVDSQEKANQEKDDLGDVQEKRVIEDAEKEEENVTAVEKGDSKDDRKEEKKEKSELTAAEIKKAFDEAEDEEDVEVII